MTIGWTAALEATATAVFLRGSVWAYPMVNAGHILGVALLVGAIIPIDLRLIGFWPSVPVAPLWRVLTRVAAFGFGLAVACGMLLFVCRATAYAQSGLFISKLLLVGIGALNALLLHRTVHHKLWAQWPANTTPPPFVRTAALISLVLWPTVLLLGRFLGYF